VAVTERSLKAWFGDHWLRGMPPPVRESVEGSLEAIRTAAYEILRNTPAGPEQSRAITRLRDQLDLAMLAAWEQYLPAWQDAWFGDHWLRGFKPEDKSRAEVILRAVQRGAESLDGDRRSLRGAWLAAMRALRCI